LRIQNKESSLVRNINVYLSQDSLAQLLWTLKLPKGSYHVKLNTNQPPLVHEEAFITIPDLDKPFSSSLVLATTAIETISNAPSEMPIFQSRDNMLHFAIAYSNCAQEQLSVRAILYRREAGDKEATYASLEQIAAVLRVGNGKTTFQGKFQLDSLSAGAYLVEVLAYKKDDRIFSELEQSREFRLRWSGLATLMERPAKAVERMVHIAGADWVAQKRDLGQEQQKIAVQAFWQKHNPRESERAMTRYFRRLDMAEKRFSASEAALCRVFALHGEAESKTFTRGNIDYMRWHYPQTGITFLFKRKAHNQEKGGNYELVY
jgi:GWxTD domain-containing protein